MSTKLRYLINVIVVLSMLLVGFPATAIAKPAAAEPAAAPSAPVQDGPAPQVSTANEEVLKKIEPELRGAAVLGAKASVKVTVMVKPGTDISAYFEKSLVISGTEFDRVVGMLPGDKLVKVASGADVYAILNMGPRPAPQPIRLTDEEGNPAEKITRSLEGASYTKPDWSVTVNGKPTKDGNGTKSFFTEDTNGVRATWALGITGDGAGWYDNEDTLKIGVIDTGVDFANPDLIYTQARVTSTNSPYYIWPIAFDDRSMSDYALGNRDYRNNYGWYMTTDLTAGMVLYGTPPVPVYPILPDGTILDPDLTSLDPFYFEVTDPSTGNPRVFTISSQFQSLSGNRGTYKFGWHPDDALASAYGKDIGVLVLFYDYFPITGPYNTVAVDMTGDDTFNFTDPPAYRGNEVIGMNLGWSASGAYDLSGGMIYFISDGVSPLPASNWMYGMGVPAAGDIVPFMLNDFTEAGGDHGTLCAGTAIGQGNIVEMPYSGTYGSNYWPPTWYDPAVEGGISQGPAMDAGLVAIGNYYEGGSTLNFYDFAALGYDGLPSGAVDDNFDQPHMVSNSYGSGSVNNDGWDVGSRYVTLINNGYIAQQGVTAPDGGMYTPAFVKSAGNSGFGYGTVNVPMPETAIVAGASGVFGQFNLGDTALTRDRVNWGDLTGMTDRGPTAMSTIGMHVLTNGEFGSGNLAVNELKGGDWSVDYWAGTSRSAPEAMGILALVYDAFYQEFGFYPGWRAGRTLLMNGARTAFNDPFAQGAGLANAFNSAEIILGNRGVAIANTEMEGFWTVGDYRGEDMESFARGLFPGDSETETFLVGNQNINPVDVSLEAVTLKMIDSRDWNFTSVPLASEGSGSRYYDRLLYGAADSNPTYGATDPIYLDTPEDTALLQEADLMVVRLSWPFEQFQNDVYGNWWFLYAWAWRDSTNNPGTWFNDINGNGVRNSGETDTPSELVRFTYDYHGNTAEIRIQQPWDRMKGEVLPGDPPLEGMDNILISLRHYSFGAFDTTDLKVTVELYSEQPWENIELSTDSVTVPASGMNTFNATANTVITSGTAFSENFDGATFPPAGWGVYDVDGGGTTWKSTSLRSHSTPNSAVHTWTYEDEVGYLVTPPIALDSAPQLRFWENTLDTFWYIYHGIQVSTGSCDPSDGDFVLVEETSDVVENTWQQQVVNLSAYANQTVCLAFVYKGYYADGWYVDDVEVDGEQVIVTPPGEYTGYIKATYTTPYEYSQYVPVTMQVWFPADVDPMLGGVDEPTLYDNGVMFGGTGTADAQRAESGDWRFFYTDVTTTPNPGTFLLTHTTWDEDPAVVVPPNATDIDTLIMGPVPNDPLFEGFEWLFGTQGLDIIGGSSRVGNPPEWDYYTTSGGPSDWASARMEDAGLYGIAAQTVRWGGNSTTMPFQINVGTVETSPALQFLGYNCIGCTQTFSFKTNHTDLAGETLEVVGYGWSQPVSGFYDITQDEYVDIPYTITATDAYRLRVNTKLTVPGQDIDLEVWKDNDGSGTVTPGDTRLGSSGRSDSEEFIQLMSPAAGDYVFSVYGYSVTDIQTFYLRAEEVSGMGGLTISDIPASITLGDVYDLTATIQTPIPGPGEWVGMIFLGPVGSPYAVEIPVYVSQGEVTKEISPYIVKPGGYGTYTIKIVEQEWVAVPWTVGDIIPDGWDVIGVTGGLYDPGTRTVSWFGAPGFGTHTISIVVRANGSVEGYVTNTAHINTGINDCTVSVKSLIATAVPTWTKTIQINAGPEIGWDGQPEYEVANGDLVTIRDYVSVKSDDPVAFVLTEVYTGNLELAGASATFGVVDSTTPGTITWTVTGGVSETEYVLTKSFHVNGEIGWTGLVEESLDTTGYGLLKKDIGFTVPIMVTKDAPATADKGSTFTYSLTVSAPDALLGPIHLEDYIPAGAEYAGNLTVTPDYGTASYDPIGNKVEWIVAAGKSAPDAPAVQAPTGFENRVKLELDSKPSSSVSQSPNQVKAGVSLVLDDGSVDNGIGLNPSGYAKQFLWFNRFTPAPGDTPFMLNEIQVYFDTLVGVSVGDAIDLVVYEDPDSNPANGATLLATYPVTVQTVPGWNTYDIVPVTIMPASGDVLIGVIDRFVETGVTPSIYPAAMDDTSSAGRSWVGSWTGDPPDPANLPSNDLYGTIDSFGLPGNWMIRGYGETLPTEVTITFDVTVTGDVGDTITNVATLDKDGFISTASAETEITGETDLELQAGTGDPVFVSDTLVYTFTVINHGPMTATGIQIVDTILNGFTVQSTSGSGWSCSQVGNLLTCDYASPVISGGNTIDLQVVLDHPGGIGTIVNHAEVSWDGDDPNLANNEVNPTYYAYALPAIMNDTTP